MSRIVVLGSGAWGTAIALSLHRRGGHEITLWAHSRRGRPADRRRRAKTRSFFPAFPLPADLTVTAEMAPIADAESSSPSFLRSSSAPPCTRVGPHLHPGQIVVSATKGVENDTFLRMTQVISADPRTRRPPALHRRTLRPQLRPRSRPGPAHRRHRRLQRPADRRAHPAGVLLRNAPPLHLHRCHRRRTRRRAQKRHRHRRRRRRRRGPRPQLHRRPHHPRHCRDHAPRRGLRRTPRNPRRSLRRRRPGAHLHRLALAATAPSARRWARAASSPRSSKASAAKSPKACSPPAPLSASPASTASRCPSPSRWN